MVPNADVCEALNAFGLGHGCRGNGTGAIIINAEFMGDDCNVNGMPTSDWNLVFSPNGGVMLSCHTRD
jgi:hypothetical protein